MSQNLKRELDRLTAQGQGKLAREIAKIYRDHPDAKGRSFLEILVPSGTGPKGK